MVHVNVQLQEVLSEDSSGEICAARYLENEPWQTQDTKLIQTHSVEQVVIGSGRRQRAHTHDVWFQ